MSALDNFECRDGDVIEQYQYWQYRKELEARRCLPRVLCALMTVAAVVMVIALAAIQVH